MATRDEKRHRLHILCKSCLETGPVLFALLTQRQQSYFVPYVAPGLRLLQAQAPSDDKDKEAITTTPQTFQNSLPFPKVLSKTLSPSFKLNIDRRLPSFAIL